jgi:hypothetical protein
MGVKPVLKREGVVCVFGRTVDGTGAPPCILNASDGLYSSAEDTGVWGCMFLVDCKKIEGMFIEKII